jgi:midasin (ATPase involved in ribosome maturation)
LTQTNSPQFEINNSSTYIGKLGVIDRNLFGTQQTYSSIPKNIVHNSYAKRYIEKIASSLYFNEPSLLIGDTGCGKTTLV